jgi:hypothetical protein
MDANKHQIFIREQHNLRSILERYAMQVVEVSDISGKGDIHMFEQLSATKTRLRISEDTLFATVKEWSKPAYKQRPSRTKAGKLPAEATVILRKWFIDHYRHPYPEDNEKVMLQMQTGLTKKQVESWFSNSRVRAWTPSKIEGAIPARTDDGRKVYTCQ